MATMPGWVYDNIMGCHVCFSSHKKWLLPTRMPHLHFPSNLVYTNIASCPACFYNVKIKKNTKMATTPGCQVYTFQATRYMTTSCGHVCFSRHTQKIFFPFVTQTGRMSGPKAHKTLVPLLLHTFPLHIPQAYLVPVYILHSFS